MAGKAKPPTTLSDPSKALWAAVLKDWSIDDAAHLKILEQGLLALDRAESCRRQIDEDGETLTDRFGQKKPHPLLAAERDSRAAFLAGMKSLGLDPEA